MTENKRFTYENHKVKDNLTGEVHSSNRVSVNVLNTLHEENEQLKQQLFEARKDYLIETADISDKLYLDEMIEEERKEIFK